MYDACIDCGKEKTGQVKRSPRCRSCSKKGNTNCLGKIATEETRRNMSKPKSEEHCKNISIARGGDGVIEPSRYPGIARWAEAVKTTFTCCVVCRNTEKLEAHHIAPKAKYPELATFALNGLTLCYDCHRGTNGVHKGNS